MILSVAVTAAALCQSCVRDVAPPEEEPSDWTDIPIPPIQHLEVNAIVSDRHGTLFLGADRDASLWRSTDRGLTWTEKTLGLKPSCKVTALLVKGGGTVFAALQGGGVFISRDHGENWIQVNNHLTDLTICSLAAAADGKIIAGASSGRIFRSDNDGGVWVEVEGDAIGTEVSVLVTDSAGAIYAGCSGEGVFFSADSGRTWTPSSSGLEDRNIRCLAIHNEGYILAGTGRGDIYRSAGGGEPWIRIDRDAISGSILAIASDPAGDIFAGTNGRGVFCSRDGGDSWERADIGLQGLDVSSLLCADDVLLAGTIYYGVFRSADRGSNWSPSGNYFPTDPDRYARFWLPNLLSIDSCGTYYLSNQGVVLRSRDRGETWVRACDRITRGLNCLAIHPNSSLLAGTNRGIFVSNDSGDSWSRTDTSSSSSAEVYALEVAKNGVIFGITAKGVLRSVDGGSSWKNVFNEAAVTSMSTGSGGHVYIGTFYRGILGSSDYGDTWRRMTDSLMVYSIAADFVGNVFALCEGAILCSSDCGTSWKTIQLQLGKDYYWYGVVAAPGGEAAVIFNDEGTLYISEDCFSTWKAVPVPYVHSSIFLSPDGHLFISDRVRPGLHRSRNALF